MTRNEEIQTLRDGGYTLKAIGEFYGITKERVRQLTFNPEQKYLLNHSRHSPSNPYKSMRKQYCSKCGI